MRPVRSIWSFLRSAQVTCSVHGARAVTDLMRGSVSALGALVELIPLLSNLWRFATIQDNASRRWHGGIAPANTSASAMRNLSLKVGSDDVNMRRIMVRGIQGDLVCAEILDRWHGVAAAEHKYTAKYAEFQVSGNRWMSAAGGAAFSKEAAAIEALHHDRWS